MLGTNNTGWITNTPDMSPINMNIGLCRDFCDIMMNKRQEFAASDIKNMMKKGKKRNGLHSASSENPFKTKSVWEKFLPEYCILLVNFLINL